ncbi:MAG: CBS domain-containing protein [Candidatus Roizmanbacteria bacterium]|nr:CBS domain-containing protein [Candidatus Roizmanbacteria bacterium]
MRLLNILKENNIIKVSPEDHLSKVLSKLSTSHDAAFVFNKENKYMGIISPYFTMIKSSFPGNTKVEHCLTHTAKIYLNYPLSKVCELFIQSKIHYLPVFDPQSEKFLGIISARRVLSYFKDQPIFKVKVEEIIRKRWQGLITVYEDDMISQAIHLFKTKKISKLVVINQERKLKGVLSYYDLIRLMISPKYSNNRGERIGDKISFYNYRVKNFAKSYVLTLSKEKLLIEVINLIVSKKIGSVIIVDKERHPLGIITTRDILRFYIDNEKRNFLKSLNPFKKILKR